MGSGFSARSEIKNNSADESKKAAKRIWWLAGLLGFLTSGLGQVYCGRLRRGIVFSVIILLLIFVFIHSVLFVAHLPHLFFLVVMPSLIVILLLIELFIIVDAIILANKYKDNYQPKPYNKWYVYLIVILVAELILSPVFRSYRKNVIQSYIIPSESMAPAILKGDFIFVDATAYRAKSPIQGDVIVFASPEHRKEFTKRVIGIPGDTIEIRNKQVFINWQRLDESYIIHTDDKILHESLIPRDNYGPIIITDGHLFILGDNRDNSLDSRILGPIGMNQVKGRVIKIYFSWNSEHTRIRWERIGLTVH